MSLLSSFLLGIIQGLAEFLPISSSGHLAVAQNLLHFSAAGADATAFTVLLHLGTLAAVIVAYWHDIVEMVREFFRAISDLIRHRSSVHTPPARRLLLLIIVGTLPLFLILPFKDRIEALSANMWFIGFAFLFTGVLLFLSDRVRRGRKTEKTATLRDTLIVGAAQAIATCPGISRSGMTICAGTFLGFDRRFAVRFSFLLSLPAVIGANLLELKDLAASGGLAASAVPACLVGIVTAGVVGYLSIRLLRMVAEKGRFGWFAYYCWAAGAATLILTALQ